MLTVKFETEAENGKIEIPEEYRRQLKGKLQVIVSVKGTKENEEKPYDILTELTENTFQNPVLKRAEFSEQERNLNKNYIDKIFINWLMKNPVKVDKSVPFLTRDEIYDRKL